MVRAGVIPEAQPWMAVGAVQRLDQILRPDVALLELGSGRSTAWYAERVASVVSVEPDRAWADMVLQMVSGRHNVELVHSDVRTFLDERDIKPFDAVIVDHLDESRWTRGDSVRIVAPTANIIVLDDSDRARYAGVVEREPGWSFERFTSLRSFPLAVTETTVMVRNQ
jgi:hypothetical protein